MHTGEALCCVQLNYADSLLGVSKRDSYTGSGGNASGGSVKNLCFRRRSVSRMLVYSGTSSNTITRSRSGGSLLGLQKKWGVSSPTLVYGL